MASAAAQKINWENAPPVPIKVLQMISAGITPVGRIVVGPFGQMAYFGPIQERVAPPSDWREGLTALTHE